MFDIQIPKPPHPFKADANVARLARVKFAASLERQSVEFRAKGFVERAWDIAERAREMREAA